MTEKPAVVIHDNSFTLSSAVKSAPTTKHASPLPAQLQAQLTQQVQAQLQGGHLPTETCMAGSTVRYFESDEQAVAFMRKQKPPPLTLSGLKEMGRNRKKRTSKKTKR
jgi:sulfur relay (sulfurtransferase) complex TusBCD TusD component (DsrE family)